MSLQTRPVQSSSELIDHLEHVSGQLSLTDFDVLLIADGSGTVSTEPAGWACTVYDRRKQEVLIHTGGWSVGTNNLAELVPFVHALWHLNQGERELVAKPVVVQIVSDSELTVRCGSGQYERRANGCYWAAIQWFEEHDYLLHWLHVRRNSNLWNEWMDAIAASARQAMAAVWPSLST